ncbi:MAG: Ig-like domain-containing protein [Maribacter sp.]|nr:Ig-like domain-containing protein [Maribacter sp.]
MEYTTGSVADDGAHNLSFGLISDVDDLSQYNGFNPFKSDNSLYGIGVNLTADDDATSRGLNFTNGNERITLHTSGLRHQFVAGEKTKIFIEVGIGGFWSLYINDQYEQSGVFSEGFDLSKSYHVAVYGQDDNGAGKSIQSIKLERQYFPGERAIGIRGHWSGGEGDIESVKDFKTLYTMRATFTSGAVESAQQRAPNKLLEQIAIDAGVASVVPTWGDLSLDEPLTDPYRTILNEIRAAGFKVKAYVNSENFVGTNTDALQSFTDAWFAWCDTNPEAQAFINSQPYHTGIWNRDTQQYEDATATFPKRKYMFCYAEYVIKDYSLRYGADINNWIFDDGSTMEDNGDNATSGILEEQRIYQAFSNAARAGNTSIPTAFQNGRSTSNYRDFPFAHAVWFEDFKFGHAFGGNNDHASKTGGQFNLNYRHVTRMTETNAYVHDGGAWTWDDGIIGNFHSKLATTAWKYGPTQAWEQDDFNQWNYEALKAGGHMTWGGSTPRSSNTLRDWAYELLKNMDDYLSENLNPEEPKWARAYTILPEATTCDPYYHVLVDGKDFWDPKGDAMSLSLWSCAPSWLTITKDEDNPGQWILSGIPNDSEDTVLEFGIDATDGEGFVGARALELKVNGGATTITNPGNGMPMWASDINTIAAFTYQEFKFDLKRCQNFEDFDGDSLSVTIENAPDWLSLTSEFKDIYQLQGTPTCAGDYTVRLALSDGTNTVYKDVEIMVADDEFIAMTSNSINGGASWNLPDLTSNTPQYSYNNRSNNYDYRALLYSDRTFQSDTGLRLTIKYTTGSIEDTGGHNFSFGLISSDTDLATYNGVNPFKTDTSVYAIGTNLTADGNADYRGLNFSNATSVTNLDESGTNVQFPTNISSTVIIEVTIDGAWSYSINGVLEASGFIAEGFDLSKSYYVAVYGQDDNGGQKTIEKIAVSTCFNTCTDNSPTSIDLEISEITCENPDSLTLTANVTGVDENIQEVAFYQDNMLIGTSTQAPYTIDIDQLSNGEYSFYALITDNCGNHITSNVKTFKSFEALTLDSVTTNVSANGNDGSIIVAATGGLAPYQYKLNDYDLVDLNVFENLPEGDYIISVNDANGCSQTLTISITGPSFISVTSVTLQLSQLEMRIGETIQLNAVINPADATNQNVFWSSSDQSIATVNDNGSVTSLTNGTVTITAKSQDGGFEATVTIIVTSTFISITDIEIEQFELAMTVGETAQLTMVINPTNATNQNVFWSTSDNSVATVDQNGTVTANGEGMVTITLITQDGAHIAQTTVIVEGYSNSESSMVYPNPARASEKMTVRYNYGKETGLANMTLYDPDGKKINFMKADLQKGMNEIEIDTFMLSTGFYFLFTLDDTGRSEVFKIIIN